MNWNKGMVFFVGMGAGIFYLLVEAYSHWNFCADASVETIVPVMKAAIISIGAVLTTFVIEFIGHLPRK